MSLAKLEILCKRSIRMAEQLTSDYTRLKQTYWSNIHWRKLGDWISSWYVGSISHSFYGSTYQWSLAKHQTPRKRQILTELLSCMIKEEPIPLMLWSEVYDQNYDMAEAWLTLYPAKFMFLFGITRALILLGSGVGIQGLQLLLMKQARRRILHINIHGWGWGPSCAIDQDGLS